MKTFALGIIAGFLAIGLHAEPASSGKARRSIEPPNAQLTRLIVPHVKFEKLNLADALQYLERKAEMELNETLQVSSRVELPDTFQPDSELTLELRAVPFPEVLRYLSQLAGAQVVVEGDVIVARAKGTVAVQTPPATVENPRRPAAPTVRRTSQPTRRTREPGQ